MSDIFLYRYNTVCRSNVNEAINTLYKRRFIIVVAIICEIIYFSIITSFHIYDYFLLINIIFWFAIINVWEFIFIIVDFLFNDDNTITIIGNYEWTIDYHFEAFRPIFEKMPKIPKRVVGKWNNKLLINDQIDDPNSDLIIIIKKNSFEKLFSKTELKFLIPKKINTMIFYDNNFRFAVWKH